MRETRRSGGACPLLPGSLSSRHRSPLQPSPGLCLGLHPLGPVLGKDPLPRPPTEKEEAEALLSFPVPGRRDLPAETLRSAVRPLRRLVSLCLVSRSVPAATTSQAGRMSSTVLTVSLWDSRPATSPRPRPALLTRSGPSSLTPVREARRCPRSGPESPGTVAAIWAVVADPTLPEPPPAAAAARGGLATRLLSHEGFQPSPSELHGV